MARFASHDLLIRNANINSSRRSISDEHGLMRAVPSGSKTDGRIGRLGGQEKIENDQRHFTQRIVTRSGATFTRSTSPCNCFYRPCADGSASCNQSITATFADQVNNGGSHNER
jgi:hypothetical protein